MTGIPVVAKALALDLFTTALEGGIGYWSVCRAYHWRGDDGEGDLNGFYAEIAESEDDEPDWVRVDLLVMDRGLRLAYDPEVHGKLSVYGLPEVAAAYVTASEMLIDAIDFDVSTADAVVQLGLFGEVVYG